MLLEYARRFQLTLSGGGGFGEIGSGRGLGCARLLQGEAIGMNAIRGSLGDLSARRVKEGQDERDARYSREQDEEILPAIAANARRCKRRLSSTEGNDGSGRRARGFSEQYQNHHRDERDDERLEMQQRCLDTEK